MQALRNGISVVSINYRLKKGVLICCEDTVRAVQFIRSKASEWNIDPTRIAASGSSAGGHLSAWVGLHDDFADSKGADPVRKQSSRLTCAIDIKGPMDPQRQGSEEDRQAASKRNKDESPLIYASPDDPPIWGSPDLVDSGESKIRHIGAKYA